MLKNTYLSRPDVNDFIDWLSLEIKQNNLIHSYTLPNNTKITFQGLADAFNQYAWRFNFSDPTGQIHTGSAFIDSARCFVTLASGLQANLPPNPANDQVICEWACAVMMWGGVTNGNVDWLKTNVVGLAREVDNVRNILSGNDEDPAVMNPIRRFNAGMTKVYSLIVPNFIIYDSRVAASLAWLVAAWCKQAGRASVPKELAFPCMPPKEGENPRIRKSRNPSNNTLIFPNMNGNVKRYAQWNMRASWILRECLTRSNNTVFHQQGSNDLRALEAALFMWGYDLGQKILPIDIELPEIEETEANPPDAIEQDEVCRANWNRLATLGGQARPFCWVFEIEKDAILIDRGQPNLDVFSTAEIFSLLHRLYDEFGFDWFPLANNVAHLTHRTERDGLGSFISYVSCNKIIEPLPARLVAQAQAASQLGPILMHYGIFQWNGAMNGIHFRLQTAPPPTIDDLRMVLSA
ncbi:hypothetical protein [Methylomicrobium sp. Wu6]|uniref:hypothetical protein n=1 Tax=Methylomicrobium sp. Wu6 TaxID=3107928 RepID=UPI002DD640EA|nr:hypothetical protein [Methylomicrobium sp. Wu6]MEC4747532.1 hypothetical protein [Methylomicrobium sp. Wu6]